MSVILGIDPSLTNTGLCWGGGPDACKSELISYEPEKGECAKVTGRAGRLAMLQAELKERLARSVPSIAFIEEYAYTKDIGYQAEFGGILRLDLYNSGIEMVEVAPTQVKKFALGKGVGKKEQILLQVYKRWGIEYNNSDEADAYVLYRIGLCYAGICEPENKAQREVLEKLKS
jgi:crossover junction endodeoxyribonuclease RuvC